MSEMQKVTENDVAYFLSWHSENRKQRIYCSLSETKGLPGEWGQRAKTYARKFFEAFSVQIEETRAEGVFQGKVIDENEKILKKTVYETTHSTLDATIRGLVRHIMQYINRGLEKDWIDDKWKDIAVKANSSTKGMAEDSPMRNAVKGVGYEL